MAEKGKFDLGGYLQGEGYALIGTTDKEGIIDVTGPDGQPGTFDVNALMKQANIPAGADVTYNTPETALAQSPVGFLDRMALSFGNPKGQVDYLKKNYPGATLTPDGDLVVKDKGVWKQVDPTNLGNGEGWDIAGDLADLTSDVILGGAQFAGATLGAGAGAAAGGVGAVPGGVAGAVAGAALGSTAIRALGRIVGTYEATPEETLKDIGLDTVLAAGGEGVALGAKNMVLPALRSGLKKLGETATPAVKNMLASAFHLSTGVPENAWSWAMDKSDAVSAVVDNLLKKSRAASAVAAAQGDNYFNRPIAASIAPGSNEAISTVARKEVLQSVKPLLGMAEDASIGTPSGLQSRLSAKYRSHLDEVVYATPDNQTFDLATPIGEAMDSVMKSLQEAGMSIRTVTPKNVKGTPNPEFVLDNVATISQRLTIPTPVAATLKKSVEEYLNSSLGVATKTSGHRGPMGMRALTDTLKKFNDLYYGLVDDIPAVEHLFGGTSKKLRDSLMETANFDSLIEGRNGSQLVKDLNQWYSGTKAVVTKVSRAAQKGPDGIDSLLRPLFEDPNSVVATGMTARSMFSTLAELVPNQKAASGILDNLYNHVYGSQLATAVPRNIRSTQGMLRTALPFVGGAVGGVGGAVAGLAATSPRAVLKAIPPAARGLSAVGSFMRGLDDKARKSFLGDPHAVGALLSIGLGGGQPSEEEVSEVLRSESP